MEYINILCNGNETIRYSKKRFLKYTESFDETSEIIIPANKEDVLLFIEFLDSEQVPVIKLNGYFGDNRERQNTIKLLNVAQYCGLKKTTCPGSAFLLDIIYENLSKELNIEFQQLIKFCRDARMKFYDYDTCKFIINNWMGLSMYNMANDEQKKQVINEALLRYKQTA